MGDEEGRIEGQRLCLLWYPDTTTFRHYPAVCEVGSF